MRGAPRGFAITSILKLFSHLRKTLGYDVDMFDHLEMAEEKYKNTIYAALLEGEERGEARGEARGEKTKAIAIARNALHMGMAISDVSRLTGLTEDEIRQLSH